MKINSPEDFKLWLNQDNNREKLHNNSIPITALPEDDPWINDNSWDEIYNQSISSSKI